MELLLLLSLCLVSTSLGEQQETSREQQIDFEDPEKLWRLRGNPQQGAFSSNTTGAHFVGLLYAGRAEFPWIVDIRPESDYTPSYAIGNLISLNKVLTTCRSIILLMRESGSLEQCKVYFCSTYLWEQHEKVDVYRSNEFDVGKDPWNGGTRLISEAQKHSTCVGTDVSQMGDESSFVDAAVLILKEDITPFAPIIGYMPWVMDPELEKVADVDLSNQLEQRMMCYVGAYGRAYRNIKTHAVVDYKMRIRVYYADWNECSRRKSFICGSYDSPCVPDSDVAPHLFCLETRAKVGSICDHHRGAPVVCNGEVHGMVVNAANIQYCNNVMPLPIVAVKIDAVTEFFEEVAA